MFQKTKIWKIKKSFIQNEELNQIALEKADFVSIEGHLCLTKGQVGLESP